MIELTNDFSWTELPKQLPVILITLGESNRDHHLEQFVYRRVPIPCQEYVI
jgi:hypothetical protein